MTVQQVIDKLEKNGDWTYIVECFIVNSELRYKRHLNDTVRRSHYDMRDEFPVLLIWIKKTKEQ